MLDDDGSNRSEPCPLPSKDSMAKGEDRLRRSSKKSLFDLNLPVLFHLCSQYNCLPVERHWKKKKQFVVELCKMVRTALYINLRIIK